MIKNAFILFSVAFIILLIFIPTFSRVQDAKQRDMDYQTSIEALEKENKTLAAEKKRLETDPFYLEKVAREKMGLIREGEVVYQLKTEETAE